MDNAVTITVPVQNAHLQPSEMQKQVVAAFLSRRNGKAVTVRFSVPKRTRSQSQNRFYWGVVLTMIAGHTGHSTEEVHGFLKEVWLPRTFIKIGANDFRNLNHVKYPTNSSSYEGTASGGYYGFQLAIYAALLETSGTSTFRTLRDAYSTAYKTLKGATVADLRILKGLTVNSVACYIENIKRDVMKNRSTIKAVEVP